VVRADDKKTARLNVIRDILTQVDYDGRSDRDRAPDPDIVIRYDPQSMEKGLIAA
jgi:hypothetical protein